jgi:putative NADH-flavin reductase
MNIFLLGATGRTGRLVAEQAGARNHAVTAIVRKSAPIRSRGRLNVIIGNPLRADVLGLTLANQDAVISCLGQRSKQDSQLLHDAAAAIIEAMAHAQVRRYIVVSQGLLFPSRNPIVAALRVILARYVADSIAMEQLVRSSELDWTIVRPPMLKEGGLPRGYRVQTDSAPHGSWSMQRTDLAEFLLDEAEKGTHKHEIVGLASAA